MLHKTNKKPNILILFADDQRFNTIHALGNEDIFTPNIDTLAHEGMAFTHAHIMGGTCVAVCMPSRAMLMTGKTLFHLKDNGQNIPEEHVLLGEAMQRNGYQTYGIGKWHNGTNSYARSFTDGAEIFFGGMDDHWNVPVCNYNPTGEYPEPKQILNHKVQKTKEEIKTDISYIYDHINHGKHSSELFSDAAIKYLEEYDTGNPFFMYVSFMAPHDPRTMPKEYLEMYDPDGILLPENFMDRHPFDNGELKVRDELLADWPRIPEEIREHIGAYYAMITHLDAQIGRIIESLKKIGEYDNTIIIFAGDNGLAVGQHGLMGKQNLYDHSVRVPLIISGPDIPRGKRSDVLCYLIDIFPTLCELTGNPFPKSVEGKSLVPVIKGEEDKLRDSIFCAYKNLQRSVRKEGYKLIEYFIGEARKTQLFNINEDPWEINDLAADPKYSEVVDSLQKELVKWQRDLDDPLI